MPTEKKLTGYPSIDKPWLKYYTEEAIKAKLPECNIYEYLWENNKKHLEDIAITYFYKNISYRELFENIDKIADSFISSGVKKGDVVTICIPNTPETIYIFFALAKISAVCNLLDPRASENVMLEHINIADSKLLITIAECYPMFKAMKAKMTVETIIVVNVTETLEAFDDIQSVNKNDKIWSDFILSGKTNSFFETEKYENCPVCILHTGGTTGIPKGAVLCHKNFHSLVVQWKELGLFYERGASLLSLMPPFVSFGLTANTYVPLICGMRLVLIPTYEPEKVVDLIEKIKPNCVPASPAHWEIMCNSEKFRNMNLNFLKVAFIGGDTLNIKIENGLNEIFAKSANGIKIIKGYGMTETTTAITMTFADRINIETSVGIALPQTNIGIFDDNNNELPYNAVGEICTLSSNIMMGYYKKDVETNNMIKRHQDGKVWLHTGDMGCINEDGILFIKGRLKRIIIRYDGIKIYPVDIESKLLECKMIHTCAVVGHADPYHVQGRIPVAYIVLNDNVQDKNKAAEFIEKFCNKNIFDYAVPQKYYYVEELPYTANGKIDFVKLETEEGKV